nr:transposase [Deltaproteobacteria bacterium]
ESFIADVEADGERVLPRFVKKELRDFLGCGILAKGFLRVRCARCRFDTVVAFSCKHRGVCPSCGGRRMAETAARLTDHVVPEVPVRQWVLSLPYRIRYRLAYDEHACTIALRAFVRTVFADLRRRARRRHGIVGGKPGGITFIQRFGSSLALNVHYHSLLFDGVYTTRDDGSVRFVPLPPPTDEQIVALTKKVGRSVRRALERAGKLLDELDPEPDALATDDPVLAAVYGSSILGRVATGERAGRQIERVGDRVTVEALEHVTSPRCARVVGFSLHADVAVPALDRKRLERLVRYTARPPVATERLGRRPDGKLYYRFRKPWRDGTLGVVFTPIEFIEKLVALIPPPQANLLRYPGVLAPGSKLRRQVVADRRRAIDAGSPVIGGAFTRGPGSKSVVSSGPRLDRTVQVGPPQRGVSGVHGPVATPATDRRGDPSARGGVDASGIPSVRLGSERPPALTSGDSYSPRASAPRRMTWRELMMRVFAVHVLECPVCRGTMKIIAEITGVELAVEPLPRLEQGLDRRVTNPRRGRGPLVQPCNGGLVVEPQRSEYSDDDLPFLLGVGRPVPHVSGAGVQDLVDLVALTEDATPQIVEAGRQHHVSHHDRAMIALSTIHFHIASGPDRLREVAQLLTD